MKTLREEFNIYLKELELKVRFDIELIENNSLIFEITESLDFIVKEYNNGYVGIFYLELVKDFFENKKENFLDYKNKKDFKEKLEIKYPKKNNKIKGVKI